MSPWTSLCNCQCLMGMMLSLLLWISLVGWYISYLVLVLWLQLMQLSCFLITGFVSMVCQWRLLVTVMWGLLVSFGRNCLSVLIVELLCLVVTIHKLMVCQSVLIDPLSSYWGVIAVVSKSVGVSICLNVNLLSTPVKVMLLLQYLFLWSTVRYLGCLWMCHLSLCSPQQ